MRGRILLIPALALAVLGGLPLSAQSTGRSPAQPVSPNILPDTQSAQEFPLWARDLRRGEVVALGVFPFTMFISTFTMDSLRYFQHDMNEAYLPWPFKGPGAVEMSRKEREQTLVAALAASAAIAVIDFAIVQVNRYQEKRRTELRNQKENIRITRKVMGEDELSPEDGEDPPEISGEPPPEEEAPEEGP
jgi:hypothetical protein